MKFTLSIKHYLKISIKISFKPIEIINTILDRLFINTQNAQNGKNIPLPFFSMLDSGFILDIMYLNFNLQFRMFNFRVNLLLLYSFI